MNDHRPYADDGEMREIMRRVEAKVIDVASDVTEVKAQTTKTNGRVRSLELWRAFMSGALTLLGLLSGWLLWLIAGGHLK